MDDSVITCDEIIDAERTKSNDEETQTCPTTFNEKNITYKTQNFYIFTNLFINYHYIIDSC